MQEPIPPIPSFAARFHSLIPMPAELSGDGPDSGSDRTPRRDAAARNDAMSRLDGARILLVENEAMVATDIDLALKDAGVRVLGPAATLPHALDLARDTAEIDAAILDVDLGGQDVYPLAEALAARAVPFVFHTGFGRCDRMDAFLANARICLKPVSVDELLAELAALLR